MAVPPDAFIGADSLTSDEPNVTVVGAGYLMLDFGVERAAWLEFESKDLLENPAQESAVQASISEYNFPWDGKTEKPIKYSNGIYRLQTNGELYEGVRFGWVFFNPAESKDVIP